MQPLPQGLCKRYYKSERDVHVLYGYAYYLCLRSVEVCSKFLMTKVEGSVNVTGFMLAYPAF